METWMWFVMLAGASFVFFAAGYLIGISRSAAATDDEFVRRPIEHPADTQHVGRFADRPHPASDAHVSQIRGHWK